MDGTLSSRAQRNYIIDIQEGDLKGHSTLRKFAYNTGVGSTEVDLWTPNITKVYATSAFTVSTESDDPEDNAAGTGARTMLITGYDEDFNKITETITLNGTTPVVSTQSFIRIFRMTVLTGGSVGFNEGVITTTLDGNIEAQIEIADNQTAMSQFTIPADTIGYVMFAQVRAESDSVLIRFKSRPPGGVFQTRKRSAIANATTTELVNGFIKLPP